MTSWQRVWREGVVPLADREGLRSLLEALERDDPRLIQGATTFPPPLMAVADWPIEGCDALTWLFWKGEGGTVGEGEEFFARMCHEIDQRVGEPAGCRWFLNWFDETPRPEMRRLLLEEIRSHLCPDESGPLWKELEESRPHEWALQGILADWYEDHGEAETARGLRWLAKSRYCPHEIIEGGGAVWAWHCYQSMRIVGTSHVPTHVFDLLPNGHAGSIRRVRIYPTFREAVLAACAAVQEAYPHE